MSAYSSNLPNSNGTDLCICDSGAHIITVAVEDYFQSRALEAVVARKQWGRFESRVEQNTLAALDLLSRYGARATFFFPTWIASRLPDLACEVIRQGHEVANSGDSRRSFRMTSPAEFAREICASRDVLESITGVELHGFRVADHRLTPRDLWALEILAEKGYRYDSSIHPSAFAFRRQPWRRFVHKEQFGERCLWEVPLSSIRPFGVDIPIAGGNWFRQLPQRLVEQAVKRWTASGRAPFVMYFRVWDLDPEQPVITAASGVSRLRHYRHPERVPCLVERFLETYRFVSIAEYLRLEPQHVRPMSIAAPDRVQLARANGSSPRTPITVVIPCYNEEHTLSYLANTLAGLSTTLEEYNPRFVFVDDGSRDRTPELLQSLFGKRMDCKVICLPKNRGVAAAIDVGIWAADTEIVCSMDCDCTYDPGELAHMIPLLQPGIDLVTASPYHPGGRVSNVPGWRLLLSKGASFLYRRALGQPLHTYTSCFRVYRRSAVLPIHLVEPGFLGIAELIGKLILRGGRIAEFPATLEVRMLGRSKMRVAKTIFGHLRLISSFVSARLFGNRTPPEHGPLPSRASSISKGVSK